MTAVASCAAADAVIAACLATAAAWEAEERKKVAEEARLHKMEKEYTAMFEDNQKAIAAKEKSIKNLPAPVNCRKAPKIVNKIIKVAETSTAVP